MLSLPVKTLDAFKFDGIAESDNTDDNQSTLSPYFTFIPVIGVGLPKSLLVFTVIAASVLIKIDSLILFRNSLTLFVILLIVAQSESLNAFCCRSRRSWLHCWPSSSMSIVAQSGKKRKLFGSLLLRISTASKSWISAERLNCAMETMIMKLRK